MRYLLCLVLSTTTAIADDVAVDGAPAIPAQPGDGVDPDVAQRFEEADALVRDNQLPRALDRVLVLYRAGDPFSTAQREPAEPRAVALLGAIGTRARAAGDLVLAARAFDARWTLTGAPDPELARVLLDWSRREPDRGQALYLARRARTADPDLVAAARRDHELSTNRRIWPMRGLILAGLAAFGGGLYADSRGHDSIATGLYIASPLISAGGILLGLSGVPNHSPESPAELPSLSAGDRR